MKTIRDQIIAGTALDSHGERLPFEALQSLFDQLPDPHFMGEAHDLAKTVVARAYNKRLVPIDEEEYAIMVDIDVYNEKVFERNKGFSISYTTPIKHVKDPSKPRDAEILINARNFDPVPFRALFEDDELDTNIAIADFKQKAAESIPIIIIMWIGQAVLSGAAWDVLKKIARKTASIAIGEDKTRNQASKIQILFKMRIDGKNVDGIFSIESDRAHMLEDEEIPLDKVRSFAREKAKGSEISKIAVTIGDSKGELQLLYIVDSERNTITL